MSLDPRGWRRFDAKAWAQAQSGPAPDAGRGRRLRNTRGVTLAQMGAAWVIFALGATSIALAQGGGGGGEPSAKAAAGEGDEVLLARRNPRSGGANRETAVVSNNGNSGLVIRPSNTAKGGRAISATCDNDGTRAEDGCAVYVNKGTGPTASFRSAGSVPFVIRDTNRGLVQNLNADLLDNFDATQLVSAARTKAGLDAETADRADSAATVDQLKTVGSFKRALSSSSNADTATARAGAAKVPIYSFGQFDVYLKCFTDTDNSVSGTQGTYAEAYISTRENGSVFDSDNDQLDGDPDFLDTNSSEDNTQITNRNTTGGGTGDGLNAAGIDADEDGVFAAFAPDGTGISGHVNLAVKNGTLPGGNGIYGGGNVCLVGGDVIG
jgi:hypothetical protein